jgi:hypothetical protein
VLRASGMCVDTKAIRSLDGNGYEVISTPPEARGSILRACDHPLRVKLPPGPRRQKAPFAGKILDNFLKASPLRARDEAHRIKGMEGHFSEVRMQHSCIVHVHRIGFVTPPNPFLVEGAEMRSTRRIE